MTSSFIQHVGQIGIPVKDIVRATQFYKETLQLPLLFQTNTMAFFQLNDLRLMLALPEKEEFEQASSVVYFNVDNIQDVFDQLNDAVLFIGQPHVVTKIGQTETWMLFFKDTEDNTHAFMSEVAVAEASY
jgi:methylmalonyl-CoA/ethylmalonyl-CoA epimerase